MIRWLLSLMLVPTLSLADFEIPYGTQNPMNFVGFPACEGGEIGYWNFLKRESADHKRSEVYMILTTVDMVDAAFVICYMPPDKKVMALGKESKS